MGQSRGNHKDGKFLSGERRFQGGPVGRKRTFKQKRNCWRSSGMMDWNVGIGFSGGFEVDESVKRRESET